MRTTKTSVLASALFGLGSVAMTTDCFGFAEVARGALTLETEGRVTYDSYFIGARKQGDDDYYLTLQPTLRYSRKAGLGELSAFAGIGIVRYDTYSEFNSEDFNAGFKAGLPVAEGSRLAGTVDLTYNESTVVDTEVMDRVPTKSFAASASFTYKLSLKTGLTDTIAYTDSSRSGYSDQKSFMNDVSFKYSEFLGSTSFRLTHSYQKTKSSGENFLNAELDQTSNAFSASLSRPIAGPLVGELTYGYRFLDRAADESLIGQTSNNGSFFTATLSGPFLPPSRFPKTKSSASLSYQESTSPGINDTGQKTLTGNVSLEWEARERTTFELGASRNVGLSANDLSVESTEVNFGVAEKVGYATSLRGNVSYMWRSFRGIDRDDKMLQGSLSASRRWNRNWTTGVSYSYQRNETSGSAIPLYTNYGFRVRPENYERHVLSAFVTNVF